MVKHPHVNARDVGRDVGLILGSGRFPAEGNGNPLKYPCLGNPRGAWRASIHGVTESESTEQLSMCARSVSLFGCIRSWSQHTGSSPRHAEFTAVHGPSGCGARSLEYAGPVVMAHGLVALRHVGS